MFVFIGVYSQSAHYPIKIKDGKDYVKLERDSSEFIFEGIVKSIDWYRRIDSKGIKCLERSTMINVAKVFRGKLKLGTVEIIEKLDTKYYGLKKDEDRVHISKGDDSTFIYFCKANIKQYDSKYNIYPVGNKQILEYFSIYD